MKYTAAYWDDVDRVIRNIPHKEKLFGTKILLTGATGMICSCIAEVLFLMEKKYNAGIKVVMAGRNRERLQERFSGIKGEWDWRYLFYDAVGYEAIKEEADFVIHGAGNASPTFYGEQPVETILGNIVGLHVLLDMVKNNGNGRLLYISSGEVYGNKDGIQEYKEEDYGIIDASNGRACYPNAKRLAESLCLAYGDEFDVDVTIARPGHIYGPSITANDSRASAQFTRDAVSGGNLVMKSEGAQKRSYCYTLDCASAVLTVLINGARNEAYNISNRNSVVTIRQWAEQLASYADVDIMVVKPSEKERRRYGMMRNSVLNADKLEELGWRAEYGLSEGIQRTVDYMRT